MTKADILKKIQENAEITVSQATKALDAVIEGVKEALVAGDKVTLIGFGSFSVTERSARTGRNPQTGEELKIAAKKAAKFSPGKELKTALNPAPVVKSKKK